MVNKEQYLKIREGLVSRNVTLVAVSKMKSEEDILDLYNLGQRDFGENYVQELLDKQSRLPSDIRWHFIGHLQSNKVKYITPFISLIHGIDSFKLLKEVNKQAQKFGRIIDVLLQVHIATESTKFGMDESELDSIFNTRLNDLVNMNHIRIKGFMGMASFSDDHEQVGTEFFKLKNLFEKYSNISKGNIALEILSMGMSDDYELAIANGSNMVRIGSLIFGRRNRL